MHQMMYVVRLSTNNMHIYHKLYRTVLFASIPNTVLIMIENCLHESLSTSYYFLS